MMSVKAFGEAEFWFAMIKVATILIFMGVAAGEAKDAAKILPKAINSMVIRIFFFYVGSVVLFAFALPYTAYSSDESPFTTFFSGLGVPHAGDIMQVVVLMVVGWYYVRGRVGNLADEAAASLQGEETLVAGD